MLLECFVDHLHCVSLLLLTILFHKCLLDPDTFLGVQTVVHFLFFKRILSHLLVVNAIIQLPIIVHLILTIDLSAQF